MKDMGIFISRRNFNVIEMNIVNKALVNSCSDRQKVSYIVRLNGIRSSC